MAPAAQETLAIDKVKAVADRGYSHGKERNKQKNACDDYGQISDFRMGSSRL
jgi:hypothetical protein